ncbi:putative non-LTR retroelement reverse transcriptase [Trifolium medium]|uniref:Putative non-LTR retroelement reverse transcriptase n=1 Tax=Trifolium medium TaxID=97028 RepID=A0A392MBY3_9FABA|nr:putative non-LTR retroelement reverse transcriptase [Trifolium medium]
MRRAVVLNLFKGFKIRSDGPSISHLQYADDTLCIGEDSIENLWTIKAILRGFELAFGLKVNFWKSCLMGINVGDNFMEMACTFLNCIQGCLPFKYFGLPVGANPRRAYTWDPLVTSLRKKLNSWGHKHISLGGRWRLLNHEDVGFWKEVLVTKYGNHILHKVGWVNVPNPYFASLWWKDICNLENCVESKKWLEESVSRLLGNGAYTRFWTDKWLGDVALVPKVVFDFSTKGCYSVSDLIVVDGVTKTCNLLWRRRLFHWEEEIVTQLLVSLENVCLSIEEDKWRWILESDGNFSVKSAFESLAKELVIGPNLTLFEAKIFSNIWESPAPSKVIAFS